MGHKKIEMLESSIESKVAKPVPALSNFVESFWKIINHSEKEHEIVVLPDGRFDIIFSYSSNEPFNIMQMGLGTEPEQNPIPPKIVMFAVSFKLLAIEYLLNMKAASLLNEAYPLPDDILGNNKEGSE